MLFFEKELSDQGNVYMYNSLPTSWLARKCKMALPSMIKMIHFGSNTMTHSYTIYWPVLPQPEITQSCPAKSPLSARFIVWTYWFIWMGATILITAMSFGRASSRPGMPPCSGIQSGCCQYRCNKNWKQENMNSNYNNIMCHRQ